MVEHYDDVFPALLEKKKAQADRVMPYRKRTALVDQRISRSDLAKDFDPQELLAQQAKRASLGSPTKPTAPVLTTQVAEPEGLAASPVEPEFKTPLGTPGEAGPPPMISPESSPVSPATTLPPVSAAPAPAPAPAPVAEKTESPIEATSGRTTPSRNSVHSTAAADEIIAPAPGAGGLKRNTSSEASRLRGPKGARGPRPAPGHGSQRGSVSKIAAQFENGGK